MSELHATSRPWSKMPAWIGRGDQLARLLPGGRFAGRSIAVIRLLIWTAICSRRQDQLTVRCSLIKLAKAMQLSLPTVRSALKEAESHGLIRYTRGGGRECSKIEILDIAAPRGAFFIVPNARAVNVNGLGKRTEISAAANKIYILLLARRPNNSDSVSIGYDKIRDGTGIQRDQIRQALSLLAINGLIDVDRETLETGPGVQNKYKIRGKFKIKSLPREVSF